MLSGLKFSSNPFKEKIFLVYYPFLEEADLLPLKQSLRAPQLKQKKLNPPRKKNQVSLFVLLKLEKEEVVEDDFEMGGMFD